MIRREKTRETQARMVELWLDGHGQAEIAKRFGCHQTAVSSDMHDFIFKFGETWFGGSRIQRREAATEALMAFRYFRK